MTRIQVGDGDGVAMASIVLPNITITDETNPQVNAVQFGEDGPGVLKEQHISSADNTTTGSGASITLNPGAAAGANQQGAPLRLSSGSSTGSGSAGGIAFLCSTAGAPGSAPNLQADKFYITDIVGFAALYPAADVNAFVGIASNRILQAHVYDSFVYDYTEGVETSTPAAPAADRGRMFYRDNGSGKTQLCVIFATGAVQVLATQP